MTALFIINRETRLVSGFDRYQSLSRLGSESLAHVVLNALSEHDPYDAHELVGERDDGFVLASSCDQISDPSTLRMGVFVSPSDHAARTVDQQYS